MGRDVPTVLAGDHTLLVVWLQAGNNKTKLSIGSASERRAGRTEERRRQKGSCMELWDEFDEQFIVGTTG